MTREVKLPIGWTWAKLDEVAASKPHALKAGPFGSTLKKSFYVPTGYKVYGQEQVISGNPYIGDYYITDEKFKQLRSCSVAPGDVLVSLVGTIGKVLVLPDDIEPGIINPRLVKLSLSSAIVSPQYIRRVIQSPQAKEFFRSQSHGGTMEILNLTILKELSFPLPPLNEQRRIVAKIEALQDHSRRAREALEAVGPLLERFRQSVLAAAFRGDLTREWREQNPDVEPAEVLLARIREERRTRWIEEEAEKGRASAEAKARKAGQPWTDEDDEKILAKERAKAEKKYTEPEPLDASELPELPEGWCWANLKTVAELKDPNPSHRYPSYENGKVPILSTQEFVGLDGWDSKTAKLVSTEFYEYQKKLCRFSPNDIIMARKGRLGLARRPPPFEKYTFSHTVFVIKCANLEYSDFLLWYLRQNSVIRWLLREMNSNAGVPTLGKAIIERLPVPIAPLKEQRIITSQICSVYKRYEHLESYTTLSVEMLDQLNQSILAKAFRGELVPQDPNDDPASVLLERIKAEREAAAPKKAKRRKKKSATS